MSLIKDIHFRWLGDYHQRLYTEILNMKREVAEGLADKLPYRDHNVLPIIQSSGTGKSRLAHELSSMIVTLPLNVALVNENDFSE